MSAVLAMEWLLQHESDPDIDEPLGEGERRGRTARKRKEFVPNSRVSLIPILDIAVEMAMVSHCKHSQKPSEHFQDMWHVLMHHLVTKDSGFVSYCIRVFSTWKFSRDIQTSCACFFIQESQRNLKLIYSVVKMVCISYQPSVSQ